MWKVNLQRLQESFFLDENSRDSVWIQKVPSENFWIAFSKSKFRSEVHLNDVKWHLWNAVQFWLEERKDSRPLFLPSPFADGIKVSFQRNCFVCVCLWFQGYPMRTHSPDLPPSALLGLLAVNSDPYSLCVGGMRRCSSRCAVSRLLVANSGIQYFTWCRRRLGSPTDRHRSSQQGAGVHSQPLLAFNS